MARVRHNEYFEVSERCQITVSQREHGMRVQSNDLRDKEQRHTIWNAYGAFAGVASWLL